MNLASLTGERLDDANESSWTGGYESQFDYVHVANKLEVQFDFPSFLHTTCFD
jgi:hypothetical protein